MTNNHIVPQILQSYECFRALEYDPLCYRNGTVIMSAEGTKVQHTYLTSDSQAIAEVEEKEEELVTIDNL